MFTAYVRLLNLAKKIIIWMLLLQEVTHIHSNVLNSHNFDLKLIEKIY